MISKELQLLIESIKIVLLDASPNVFKNLTNDPKLNWQRVDKLLKNHCIRPIFYQACRNINFQNDLVERVGVFTKKQAIKNLFDGQETSYILDFFKQNNIPALPYKGQLFLEYLYQNRPLRESCDIDIIVQPENLYESLKLLLADGYKLSIKGELTYTLFKEIYRFYGREVGLDKKTKVGKDVHIDFHWGINESFHEYPIGVDDFFKEAELNDFNKKEVLVPSINTIFKMLLNHHGGRGCWLRLKDMCDLIVFRKSYLQFETSQMVEIAQKMGMVNILNQGIFLSDTFFSDTIIREVSESQKKAKEILAFWDKAEHYTHVNLRARLAYEKIYRSLQDKNWSWFKSIRLNINSMSIPNPMESERLIIFPDSFIYLNFFTKILSGIWKLLKK